MFGDMYILIMIVFDNDNWLTCVIIADYEQNVTGNYLLSMSDFPIKHKSSFFFGMGEEFENHGEEMTNITMNKLLMKIWSKAAYCKTFNNIIRQTLLEGEMLLNMLWNWMNRSKIWLATLQINQYNNSINIQFNLFNLNFQLEKLICKHKN